MRRKSICMVAGILLLLVGILSGCGNECTQADKLIREQQYDKAIEILDKYVAEHGDDHTGWMLLGDAYIGKARSIGGYGYNPATFDIVMKGVDYYKKSKKIKATKLIDDKMAIASGMLEAQ